LSAAEVNMGASAFTENARNTRTNTTGKSLGKFKCSPLIPNISNLFELINA